MGGRHEDLEDGHGVRRGRPAQPGPGANAAEQLHGPVPGDRNILLLLLVVVVVAVVVVVILVIISIIIQI